MARYNLTTVRPKGFLHVSAFAEVKDSLAWALTALGHEAVLTENSFSAGASTNVIFGAELLPPTQQIPPNSILYNLEQPTHPGIENVRALADRYRLLVWDLSDVNVRNWISRGIPSAHLPIGYTPNLTRIPRASAQDIDVFFAGWMTQRRVQLLADLRAAGLNVYSADNCYGGSRDQLLSRSKVCLNMHQDGHSQFEIVRVSYLLANELCVVTENSSDDIEYPFWHGDINPYDNLVSACGELSKHDAIRRDMERKSYELIAQDFTASVERVLDSGSSATAATIRVVPSASAAIQSRYDRACREGDMIDFAPWLRAHACGKILEIGTRDGASTSALLLGLDDDANPEGHLTSIDITDCSGLWSHPRWTFLRANSLDVSFPDATFDMILIDGDHMQPAYRGDLYNAWHWCRPGGLILSHDIKPERGHEFYAVGIREEFDKFCALHPEAKNWIIPGKYGMGVIRKPRAEEACA